MKRFKIDRDQIPPVGEPQDAQSMRAFTFDVLEAKGGRVIGRVTIADGPPRRLVQKAIRWAQRQGVVLGKARVARRVATDSGVEYLTVTWMAE